MLGTERHKYYYHPVLTETMPHSILRARQAGNQTIERRRSRKGVCRGLRAVLRRPWCTVGSGVSHDELTCEGDVLSKEREEHVAMGTRASRDMI